jgi:hypothetical protein
MMKAQADFMAANTAAAADKRNEFQATRGAYVNAKPGAGGPYSVTASDGRVTVFSPDGKIMSVTEPQRPGATAGGYAIAASPPPIAPGGPVGMPPGAGPALTPAPVPVAPVQPGAREMVGQPPSGYAPVPMGAPGARNLPELEQRLQKLEAQMNALSQELRSLHKEISASRQTTPDQPRAK